MADRESTVDGKLITSLRVVDLKSELEKRGLSKSGTKKELLDRLKSQLEFEKAENAAENTTYESNEVPNLQLQNQPLAEDNDLIREYLVKQQEQYKAQKQERDHIEDTEEKQEIQEVENQNSCNDNVQINTDIPEVTSSSNLVADEVKTDCQIDVPVDNDAKDNSNEENVDGITNNVQLLEEEPDLEEIIELGTNPEEIRELEKADRCDTTTADVQNSEKTDELEQGSARKLGNSWTKMSPSLKCDSANDACDHLHDNVEMSNSSTAEDASIQHAPQLHDCLNQMTCVESHNNLIVNEKKRKRGNRRGEAKETPPECKDRRITIERTEGEGSEGVLRKVSLVEGHGRKMQSSTPPQRAPTRIVHITNLVRPFTLNQLKELLSRTGTLQDEGFWIDKIKSNCYVTYETEEQARETKQALHGVRWPASNPKTLRVEFATQEELNMRERAMAEPVVVEEPHQDWEDAKKKEDKRDKERDHEREKRIAEKEEMRRQRMAERERRIAEIEKAEKDRNDAQKLERERRHQKPPERNVSPRRRK